MSAGTPGGDSTAGSAGSAGSARDDGPERGVPCDYCGVAALAWRKCKLICGNCNNINKSCADL